MPRVLSTPEGTTTEGASENLNAALGAIGESRRRSQDTGGVACGQKDLCFSCYSQAAFPGPPAEYQVLPAVSLGILGCSFQWPRGILGDTFGLLGITEAPFQVPAPLQLQIHSQALLWDDPRISHSAELHRPAVVSTYATGLALPRDTGSREPRLIIFFTAIFQAKIPPSLCYNKCRNVKNRSAARPLGVKAKVSIYEGLHATQNSAGCKMCMHFLLIMPIHMFVQSSSSTLAASGHPCNAAR